VLVNDHEAIPSECHTALDTSGALKNSHRGRAEEALALKPMNRSMGRYDVFRRDTYLCAKDRGQAAAGFFSFFVPALEGGSHPAKRWMFNRLSPRPRGIFASRKSSEPGYRSVTTATPAPTQRHKAARVRRTMSYFSFDMSTLTAWVRVARAQGRHRSAGRAR